MNYKISRNFIKNQFSSTHLNKTKNQLLKSPSFSMLPGFKVNFCLSLALSCSIGD